FDFYGYSACINGWNIDGKDYNVDEDYLSVKRIKEYKDAGMTIYFPQAAADVTDETAKDWEHGTAKRALDYALEAGIDKVILRDVRLQTLSKTSFGTAEEVEAMIKDGPVYDHPNYGLVGKGKRFATEKDLDKYVAECMSLYKDHKAFYGIMIGDEPCFYHAKSYGEMYRSIKRVCPKAFVQYNLNPITAGITRKRCTQTFPPIEGADGLDEAELMIKGYDAYVRLFLDSTGADYIQYDQYPLYCADHINNWYVFGLQMVSEIAKEYKADFYFVSQTINTSDENNPNVRVFSDADLRWLNNMLVGFGIKQISYFTYFTKADNNAEHFKDGSCFITWRGEKTDIYYWMQRIMKEEQKFAPTVLSFGYSTSKVYVKPTAEFDVGHVKSVFQTPEFKNPVEVDVDKAVALVTELYDGEKGNYLYMVQNIIDPHHTAADGTQTVTVAF
ncbi:MAG: hypothetical protein MJ072_04760, partial [Clostridia bacterium]|nr:hypothetical protein [Clostridia bacterium]